jgi:hypothetical protein
MIAYMILAFLAGGFFGMVAMAMLASGPKLMLLHENTVLKRKLVGMESPARSRRIVHVKDPEAVFEYLGR